MSAAALICSGFRTMLIDAEFPCAYCGEINATSIDLSAGKAQSYIEDCQVCCRPNRLEIQFDSNAPGQVQIESYPESDLEY